MRSSAPHPSIWQNLVAAITGAAGQQSLSQNTTAIRRDFLSLSRHRRIAGKQPTLLLVEILGCRGGVAIVLQRIATSHVTATRNQFMTARTFVGPRLRDCCALPALVLGVSLAMTISAMAQGQTELFPSACAAKEVPSLTVIEEHGQAQDISAERLSHAVMTLYRARAICIEGRVAEAVAMYDSILDLGPVAALRRQ